jgi:hypothetical protein
MKATEKQHATRRIRDIAAPFIKNISVICDGDQGDDISVEAIAESNPAWILVMDRDAAVAADDPAYAPAADILENSEALTGVTAGGHVARFGMPVDPGNLLFLGDHAGRPVVGLPGCARSPALNGADWVLERLACGLAGVLWASRFEAAQTNTALGFELQTVAASVVGGVSISGGVGTVPGVLLGALLLGTIDNSLPLLRISPFWQLALQGLLILTAVVVDNLILRGAQRRRRR